MPEKIEKIINIIEEIAPPYLAEDWDNIGFQIGNIDKPVKKALVCLEVTDAVIDEAVSENIDIILSHHPLIYNPMKNIRTDDVTGDLIYRLNRNDIALYCTHTNLDSVRGGVSDVLAQKLEVLDTKPLVTTEREKYFKLVVFVPDSHLDVVIDAMCHAGGHIGNYSHCTFQTDGFGTFKPLEGSEPFIGKPGTIEKTPEIRIETIVPREKLNLVIQEMIKAHPYEEVAYDIFPLNNKIHRHGIGRVGNLKNPLKLSQLCERIKERLGMTHIKFAGDPDKQVQKVGLCGGGGSAMFTNAFQAGCDCYITGDVKYHDAQHALHLGIGIIDAGHFYTEQIICDTFARRLKQIVQERKYDIEILLSKININPFRIL